MGGDAAGQGVRPRDTGTGERVGSPGHWWGALSTGTAVRASGRATRTGGIESLRGGRLGGWVVLGGRGCVCVCVCEGAHGSGDGGGGATGGH